MEVDADDRAYDSLSEHPRAADLAALTRALLTSAVEARRAENEPARVAELTARAHLSREDTVTPLGNAFDVLERGPEDAAERALANALAARAYALAPLTRDDVDRVASEILWLAAHTAFDVTGLLDRALGALAPSVWQAIAEHIRRRDSGARSTLDRGEAIVGAIALALSQAPSAGRLASTLARDVHDRKVAWALIGSGGAANDIGPIAGERAPAGAGPVATIVLAVTGLLLAMRGARLAARFVLALKSPAEVSLLPDGGVRLHWRVQMLGRTLRESDLLLTRQELLKVVREVRYPRFAFYAGLLALIVGSYLGISAFVDGVHVASPSLLGSGLGLVALGLVLDFALVTASPATPGRCRMLFVPRTGSTVCIAGVDPERADALLKRLAPP